MKKHFITGLVILLPATLTVVILSFLVDFLTAPFIDVVQPLLVKLNIDKGLLVFSSEQTLYYATRLTILIALAAVIISIGYIGRWFFVRYLLKMSEGVLEQIPFISSIYKTSQEVIHTLFISSNNSFKQVVLAPFPHTQSLAVGLLTKDNIQSLIPGDERLFVSVFVPTTPNPTSGFLMMYDQKDVTYLDVKVEDALKHIISCGVIPLNLKQLT